MRISQGIRKIYWVEIFCAIRRLMKNKKWIA